MTFKSRSSTNPNTQNIQESLYLIDKTINKLNYEIKKINTILRLINQQN
ncbi:hypothetical protein ACFLYH_03280 [Candidatus Dependentiae bacterium]